MLSESAALLVYGANVSIVDLSFMKQRESEPANRVWIMEMDKHHITISTYE